MHKCCAPNATVLIRDLLQKKEREINNISPTMENNTPEPGVHCKNSINMPQAGVFIKWLFVWPKGQLVIHKNEKGHPSVELHSKVKSGKSYRNRFLSMKDLV